MSLDVWLTIETPQIKSSTGIFVRGDGQNHELNIGEVKEQFPEYEIVEQHHESTTVFEYNITHNLTRMADAVNIYGVLWRPDENHINYASQLIESLTSGLELLRDDPEHFKQFNPTNGWGSYEGLCKFISRYLDACKQYPNAKVNVSR